jgi:primosomal replication protein N
LFELDALRHTPAGIPVIEFRLLHESEQLEAGQMRRVECEMACVALGDSARVMSGARPGGQLRVGGFLAAKSLKRRSPVLHIDTIEFLEGANHGV